MKSRPPASDDSEQVNVKTDEIRDSPMNMVNMMNIKIVKRGRHRQADARTSRKSNAELLLSNSHTPGIKTNICAR